METTLFDVQGDPVAYLSDDYDRTIYLWDGRPVAYLYEGQHVYGFNGRHLGWFIDQVLYDENGDRVGYTFVSCPTAVAKEPVKSKKLPRDEMTSRWKLPATPNLGFQPSSRALAEFLEKGRVVRNRPRP
jgi:hypothetical protein